MAGSLANALRDLRRNPMRALLTTLGIVIGVAAVIAVIDIGSGATGSLETTLSDLGVRNLLIRPGASVRNGLREGPGSAVTLTPEDCDAIRRECPAVSAAVPIQNAWTRAVYGNNNWSPADCTGTAPDYLTVRGWQVERGGMFDDEDVRLGRTVCVIGRTVEEELFGSAIGLGRNIRINGVSFEVVGVLAYKGANLVGHDQDDIVLMPWTTLRNRVSGVNRSFPSAGDPAYPEIAENISADTLYTIRFNSIAAIMAVTWRDADIDEARRQVAALLRQRHGLAAAAPDDFSIRDFAEIGRMIDAAVGLMRTLLMVVAMISLAVGGVGIMNIMMVSVTERTREIGLRMAVGARSRDILRQFLTEAVTLCAIGGIIGIAIGRGTALTLEILLGWTAGSSPAAVAAGLGVSMTVGVIFGFYPAWKASRLDPIEALRYE